ncbi:MAG: ABC transporter substrate-binding protein [Planctomycetes bacterium]|nr:ABC transporter substrate-binding protein [Planctomycetota bacterium]
MNSRYRPIAISVTLLAVGIGLIWWWNSRPPNTGGRPGPTIVRAAVAPFAANLPFFVLQEQKLLDSPSVRLEIVTARDPSESLNLVLSGHADVGASAFTGTFAALSRQPDAVRLFMPMYESGAAPTSYLLVPTDSPIRGLRELSGKRVGTYTGATQLLFLRLVLDQAGVGSANVTTVQVEPNLQLPALNAGQYDALFTVDTYAALALARGQARALVVGPRPTYITDPFWLGSAFVSKSWADTHSREMADLVNALDAAIAWIRANPEQSKRLLPSRTPIPEDVLGSLNLPHWVSSTETVDMDSVQHLADLLKDHAILSAPLNVAPHFLAAKRSRK